MKMNYPVLLSLCLFFFAAYGILDDNQKEEHGILADNQNEKPCGINCDVQNEQRDNLNEETDDISANNQNETQTCSVCWDNNPDTSIGVCSHKFCKGCIDTWKFDKRIYRCPLCNHVYANPDIPTDVNIIYHDLIDEFLEDLNYINMISDYYNNNRTLQEIIDEMLGDLNFIDAITDITGTSIITFEVSNDLNTLAESMRNINRDSIYSDNDFGEVMRNINTIPDNIDDNSRFIINIFAEALRNINTSSENSGED
ncbi:uncharacterized protein LOC126894277 isoform X4 [Daktulosphaira vitifoliae]|uniref:uncharacterized protein LOC126894277 isoform X4 n=1 Tax=Daktulosphaira vitifoliae TaxID=58002 RepID=UPI0021AA86E2|nr:uncharacterized protein LOC126894277 isoform X4 [Daktulosphaira vitifoliae]